MLRSYCIVVIFSPWLLLRRGHYARPIIIVAIICDHFYNFYCILFYRIIVTAKDNGTLLRSSIWNEILELNALVHNTTIEWSDNEFLNFSALCARWEKECFENDFLDLSEIMPEIENGSLRLSYPVMFNPKTFSSYALPLIFGGIELNNDSNSVVSVHAILLNYFIADDSPEQNLRYLLRNQAINTT